MAYDINTDFDRENPDLTDDRDIQNEIFMQAFNSGDGDLFNSLYLEDSISNFSGEPLTGEARRAFIREYLATNPVSTAELTTSYVAGDVALIKVEYTIDNPGPNGPVRVEGYCTDVLRLGKDGRWLMAIDRPVATTGLVAAE
ncbi:YybH family protein [Streptomyces sp. NPDC014894]|uniref:YybH family protein n=1 Tax=unclassified Streptomyces TaxID=2593676 RepID=UPI003700B0F9